MRPFKRPRTDDDRSETPETPVSARRSPPIPDAAVSQTDLTDLISVPGPGEDVLGAEDAELSESNAANFAPFDGKPAGTAAAAAAAADSREEQGSGSDAVGDTGDTGDVGDVGDEVEFAFDSDSDSDADPEPLSAGEEEIIKALEACLDGIRKDDPTERVKIPAEEAKHLQQYLFQNGALKTLQQFVGLYTDIGMEFDTVNSPSNAIPIPETKYTIPEVFAGLGFPIPIDIAAKYTNDQFERFLLPVIKLFVQSRKRLPYPHNVDELCEVISRSSNILVITGAGISTSLGIPDFRSAKTGLYARVSHLGVSDPQEVFDISLFREDPSIFYSIAREILPGSEKKPFSPTHAFIKLLNDKGKLLRNYTQNIDNIEANAGVPADKLVQCHGSFASVTCQTCKYQAPGETIFTDIRAAVVPMCPVCTPKPGKERDDDPPNAHVLKPDITFFGEPLPSRFDDLLFGPNGDAANCDLIICIGTSLKVAPVSEIIRLVSRDTPQVYISKTPIRHNEFDVTMLGASDDAVEWLIDRMAHHEHDKSWQLVHDMNRRTEKFDAETYPDGKIVYDDHAGTYTFLSDKPEAEESEESDNEYDEDIGAEIEQELGMLKEAHVEERIES